MSHASSPRPGSDRTFGFFFAVLFGALGAWALWKGREWGWVATGIGVALALVAGIAPRLLAGANRAWFALGMLLGRIVNPIVLGALFFLVVTPMALLMRAVGKRPLNLRFDRAAPTYWIERTPPGPSPQSMREQF